MHREVLHIPLLMRLPGHIPAGLRDHRVASLADLPATISALLDDNHDWPGTNLFAASPAREHAFARLQPNSWGPEHWPNHDGWLESVITSRWHFIIHENGPTELFDWQQDPAELHNLAHTPEGASVIAGFQEQLAQRPGHEPAARHIGNE